MAGSVQRQQGAEELCGQQASRHQDGYVISCVSRIYVWDVINLLWRQADGAANVWRDLNEYMCVVTWE